MQRTPRSGSTRSEKKKRETPRAKKRANYAIVGVAVLVAGGLGLAVAEERRVEARNAETVANYAPPDMEVEGQTVLSVIGDSYTGGSDMGGYEGENWVPKTVRMLSTEEEPVVQSRMGMGGSGYVNRGPRDTVFGDVIRGTFVNDSDVVLFFGSINDLDHPVDEVGDAAAEAYSRTVKAHPEATLVVAGPAWPRDDVPEKIEQISDRLESEAKKAGAVWIDPLEEGWFREDPSLIGEDGTHPTNEGHTYMAERFAAHLGDLLE